MGDGVILSLYRLGSGGREFDEVADSGQADLLTERWAARHRVTFCGQTSITLLHARLTTLRRTRSAPALDLRSAVTALTDTPSNMNAPRRAQPASGSAHQSGMDARVNPG